MLKMKEGIPDLPLVAVFPFLQEGIFVTFKNQLVYCNDAIYNLVGYSTGEFGPDDYLKLFSSESRQFIEENLNNRLSGKPYKTSYPLTLVHKNQRDRIYVNVQVNDIKEGPYSGFGIGIVQNVTRARISEKLLEASQQTLEEIISSFPDIYYVTDGAGNLIKVSPSVRQILGYEPEEVIGKNMSSFYPDPSYRDKIVGQVAAGKGQYVRVEAALLHKDGHPVWFNTRARFLFDSHGAISGLEGVARDSTAELQRQEDILLHQARHAQMGEMLSAITHQWRQPLGILSLLMSRIDQLTERPEIDLNEIRSVVQRSEKVIKNMAQTIEDFKDFFVPRSLAVKFDLSKSVQDSLQMVQEWIGKYNISLKLNLEPGVMVTGRPTEVSHIVFNLIHNAGEEFIVKQTKNPEIEIQLRTEASDVVLEVTDNAGGIPSDILPNIFDPYFTTKKTGTGIGLYMAKNIVEHHLKGRMSVENVKTGARFTIRISR